MTDTHFDRWRDELVNDVNREIRSILDDVFRTSPERGHALVGRVYDSVYEYLSNGGRRMHAATVVLAYEACGGLGRGVVLPAAAGLQLYHHHTLVHDDIFDGDDRRRGAATIHRAFIDWFARTDPAQRRGDGSILFAGEPERRGAIAGWLQGKVVHAIAFEAISRAPADRLTVFEIVRELNGHDVHDAAGQLKDVYHERSTALEPARCEAIARLKTGRLFTVCARAGGALAGATPAQHAALAAWVEAVATAYQLQDDAEDLRAESEKGTGRGVGSDIRTAKPTFVLASAIRLADPAQREFFEQWLSDAIAPPASDVIGTIVATGALEVTDTRVLELLSEGQRALELAQPPLRPGAVDLMRQFGEYYLSQCYWAVPGTGQDGWRQPPVTSTEPMRTPVADVDHVIFDVHGVIVDTCQSGGLSPARVVEALRECGRAVYFVTNSSSSSPANLVELLLAHGIEAEPPSVVSAGQAVAFWLREHYQDARLFVVGQAGFRRLIDSFCGPAVRIVDEGPADVVVVARDPQCSEPRVAAAAAAIHAGASFVAASLDSSFEINGSSVPGPRRLVQRLQDLTGVSPLILGKPSPYILTNILRFTPDCLRRTLIVGNRSDTDVRFGASLGARTALLAPRRRCAYRGRHWVVNRLEQLLVVEPVGKQVSLVNGRSAQ